MATLHNLVSILSNSLGCAHQIFSYSWTFTWALFWPRAVLAARLLAAESQLAVCKHRIRQKKDPRPRFTPAFRFLWVVLSKFLESWESWAHLMQPATVKR